MSNVKSIVVVLALMLMLTGIGMAENLSGGQWVSGGLGAPDIYINGNPEITNHQRYVNYTDAGAVANDTNGDVIVTVTGTVNTTKQGIYTITYEATNGAGTTYAYRNVTVIDTIAPADVTNLKVDMVTTTTIDLTWSNSNAILSPDFTNVVISVYNHGEVHDETTVVSGWNKNHIGAKESVTIDGLTPGTTYDILVQTADDAE